jgi:uncharacterized membrane protein
MWRTTSSIVLMLLLLLLLLMGDNWIVRRVMSCDDAMNQTMHIIFFIHNAIIAIIAIVAIVARVESSRRVCFGEVARLVAETADLAPNLN